MELRGREKYIVTTLGLLISIGWIVAYRHLHKGSNPPYEFATALKGSITQRVLATGTINPVITVQVGSQVSGIIREIYADYDSPVKRGQLIALIDPDSFYAQLAQAEANLTTAKANLARQEANLIHSRALLEKAIVQFREAELSVNRTRALFSGGFVSKSQLDTAVACYDTAYAQRKAQEAQSEAELQGLQAARAQVTQWEAAVNFAKVNLEYTRIRSPIDGLIISRNVDIGQTIVASLQSPTLFVVAKDLTKMEINADISEADIGRIKLDQEVTFNVDAFPGRTFTGRVKEIRTAPKTVQNIVTYGVIAEIDNKEMILKPGMTATVWIKTAYKQSVLLIPLSAVKEQEGKRYVEVKEGKEIKKKRVETGLKGTERFVEIISGLREGEKVVISTKQK